MSIDKFIAAATLCNVRRILDNRIATAMLDDHSSLQRLFALMGYETMRATICSLYPP